MQSLATKNSFSPTPTISGLSLRAAISSLGFAELNAKNANEPFSRAHAPNTAMRCPTRMSYSRMPFQRIELQAGIDFVNLARVLDYPHRRTAFYDGNACRIVPSILQSLEARMQNFPDGPEAQIPYDSTHETKPLKQFLKDNPLFRAKAAKRRSN